MKRERLMLGIGLAGLLAAGTAVAAPRRNARFVEPTPGEAVDCRLSVPLQANGKPGTGRFRYDGGDLYYDANGRSSADVTATEKMRDGWAYTWRFRGASSGGAKISCGDGVLLTFSFSPKGASWRVNRTKMGLQGPLSGVGAGLTPKETVERKFWWPDDLSDLMERYNALPPSLDMNVETYELTLECRGDLVCVRLNGVMTADAFAVNPEKFYAEEPRLLLSGGMRFRGLEKRPLPPSLATYEPVSMDLQLNCAGVDGSPLMEKTPPKKGAGFELGGVPFRWNVPKDASAPDNVDVGESWFFQHRLDIAGMYWFEMRRWPEAGRRFPGRLVFSVPNAEYDRLYVLAASDTSRPDSIDTFTVQFFGAAQTGQPQSFRSPSVPSVYAKPVKGVPVREIQFENGRTGYVHLVEIPLDFTRWREFSDSKTLNFELTKDVSPWRMWPDPCYGSSNGAGLPSRVHVFAMTFRRTDLPMTFRPTQLANLFVEGEKPGYDVTFSNATARAVKVVGTLEAKSWDGLERKSVPFEIPLDAGAEKTTRLELPLEKFGHFDVTLTWSKGPKTATNAYRRALAHIRKRPHEQREMDTRGFMFGFWPWLGGHRTPPAADQLELAGRLGMETLGCGVQLKPPLATNEQIVAICRKYGIRNYCSHLFRYNEFGQQPGKDGIRRIEGISLTNYNKCANGSTILPKSATQDPRIQLFFAEPGGIGTEGVPGELYGEPNVPRTSGEEYEFYRLWFSVKSYVGALNDYEKKTGVHHVKLLPWGDPGLGVPFLTERPEPEFDCIDGTAFDAPLFARLPEAQLSQNCSMFRAWMFNTAWRKRHPGKKPWNVAMEGPFFEPFEPCYSTDETARAAKAVRMMLMLGANEVPRQWSCCEIADPADFWGEEQYGGSGLFGRVTELNPHVACAAYATTIRHLRDMEFEGWDELPTRSVYSLRFRNYKTKELLRVLWCLKGTREVKVEGEGEGKLTVYDSMDNVIDSSKGLRLSIMPIWVYGSAEKATFALGEPDNSDSKLGPHAVRLGAAKDLLKTKVGFFSSAASDDDYLNSFRIMYRRFPADFAVEPTEEGLSVAMRDPKKEKDRGVMPYYTTLHCDVKLAGVPSQLSLNVKGCSDWGRVVYELVDAKGEKWVSNGQKDAWNVDDQDARSYFVHDGWRLLRFGLPGNHPYDLARKLPSTWWGCYGGDGIVDYPLTLKKVYVERRPKTMYVNSLESVPNFGAAVLGDLYVEYESEDDKTEEAVLKSRIRMKVDASVRSDPYSELKKTGTLPATELLSVEHPAIQDRDGQKGLFSFREVEGAVRYDLYLSLDPDGRGAVKVKSLKKSGERVDGLKANRDCYAFLVWYDKKGVQSAPSPIFKYALQDIFSNK